MKKIINTLLFATLLVSCEKYPGPGAESVEVFNFSILGNNQSAEGGEYLPQEVGVKVDLNSVLPVSNKKFRMEIQVTEGGGSVDNEMISADATGTMTTRWKLGETTNAQELTCRILDSDDKFYSELTLNATAFFMDKWNTISTGFLVGIQDMVRDTVNNQSMLLSGQNIYVSQTKFYDWQTIAFPFNAVLKELEVNSKGEIFGGGWNGNLYKSTDWGQNWTLVSKPISDYNYNFELSISKDDYIWVSRWDQDMHCSKDGGFTWQKDTSGTANDHPLGPVYLFNDTSHLALGLKIKQTFDGGITWSALNTPKYPSTLFVTDENELILQGQQNGFTLYKSNDQGNTYRQVFAPVVAFGTTSWHCYDKFKNDYYVLAPGGGVWKTKDFEHFEKLITFSLQRNLFIDHQGAIYAGGFNYANAEPEPTLVFPPGQ